MYDKFNIFFKKCMNNKTYSNTIYLCFYLFILSLSPILSKGYYKIFKNTLLQICLIIIILLTSLYNKKLTIVILLAYCISYSYAIITKYNNLVFENFDMDTGLEIFPKTKKNESLKSMIDNEKNVKILWSDNYLGKQLGLNK